MFNSTKGRAAIQPPRIIYSLWLQGIDQAPPLVRLNFERWRQLNPGYSLEILDEAAVRQMLGHLPLRLEAMAPQALSDVVRAWLLSRHGGIWVDASVFPLAPLDEWLPAHMTQSGFFAFERPGPDRPISSWFLAATADNRMMTRWWEKVADYWSVPRELRRGKPHDPVAAVTTWPDSYPYFWFHYLFRLLLETEDGFAEAWAKCAKVPAIPATELHTRLAKEPQPGPEELARLAALAPVQKLKWRAAYPLAILATLRWNPPKPSSARMSVRPLLAFLRGLR
jgi:Capsular polysaccharide synthesis protein